MKTPTDLSAFRPLDSFSPEAITLDITREKCPMTFVRTRLALDGMVPGSVLAVRLRGEEPHKNVLRSVLALGHAVLSEQTEADGSVVLTILKKDPTPAG